MKKSAKATESEGSDVASRNSEARHSFNALTSIQLLGGYNKFQKQANVTVKRSSVRSLREAFENSIKSESIDKTDVSRVADDTTIDHGGGGIGSTPKRLSRIDLSRIPVRNKRVPTGPSSNNEPDTQVCLEGKLGHGNKLDNSTNKGKKEIVDQKISEGSFTTYDDFEYKVNECPSTSNDVVDEKVKKDSFTTNDNKAIDTVGTAINPLSASVTNEISPSFPEAHKTTQTNTSEVLETPQNRLSASQSVIEKLQQNLSTKLSSAAIETFKQSYSPSIERKRVVSAGDSPLINAPLPFISKTYPNSFESNKDSGTTCKEVPPNKSNAIPSFPNYAITVSKDEKLECLSAGLNLPKVRSPENSIKNNIETKTFAPPNKVKDSTSNYAEENRRIKNNFMNDEYTLEHEPTKLNDSRPRQIGSPLTLGNCNTVNENKALNISNEKRELKTENPNSLKLLETSINTKPFSSFEEVLSSPELRKSRSSGGSSVEIEGNTSGGKPERVSWTTSLIQKLAQEQTTKKIKTVKKVQRQGKIVRFPEKKSLSAEERLKSKPTPQINKKDCFPEKSILHTEPELRSQHIQNDSTSQIDSENFAFVKRSDILKDTEKDAYASIITKLTEERNTDLNLDNTHETNSNINKPLLINSVRDDTNSNAHQEEFLNQQLKSKNKQVHEIWTDTSSSDSSDYYQRQSSQVLEDIILSKDRIELREKSESKINTILEQRKSTVPENKRVLPKNNRVNYQNLVVTAQSEKRPTQFQTPNLPERQPFDKSKTPILENSSTSPANQKSSLISKPAVPVRTSSLEVKRFSSIDNQTIRTAPPQETENVKSKGKDERDKQSAIRKLFTNGLFSSPRRQSTSDKKSSPRENVQLLRKENTKKLSPKQNRSKYVGDSKVHPSLPRPVLETAFLSNIPSKDVTTSAFSTPIRNDIGIQAKGTPTSPYSRSRSLSPNQLRLRNSTSSPSSPNRTIPDTSLILEERFGKERQGVQSPIQHTTTQQTPAISSQNKLFQRHNSLPISQIRRTPFKPSRSPPTPTNEYPQHYQIYENFTNTSKSLSVQYHQPKNELQDENGRSRNSISSCSSTSTIVPQEIESSLSWNPILLNQVISGSSDLIKPQQKPHQNNRNVTEVEVHNQHLIPLSKKKFQDIRRGPVQYHSSETTRKFELPPQREYEPFHAQNPSTPSGRTSAPPIPYIENYTNTRVFSSEPSKSQLSYSPNDVHVKVQRQLSPSNQNNSSRAGLLVPVGAHTVSSQRQNLIQDLQRSRSLSPHHRKFHTSNFTQVPSSLGREIYRALTPQEKDAIHHHLQKDQSISSQSSYSPNSSNSSPGQPLSPQKSSPQKLSRQEIEALFWEGHRKRNISSSQQLSPPSELRAREHHTSTGSLKTQSHPLTLRPADQPMAIEIRDSHLNTFGRSAQLVRPQPIYQNNNIVRQSPLIFQYPQPQPIHSNRSRSVSPGPRGTSGRSLSLPRQVSSTLSLLPQRDNSGSPCNFVRGAAQRNTIGPITTSQPHIPTSSTPTIYEEFGDVHLRHPENQMQRRVNDNVGYARVYNGKVVNNVSRAQSDVDVTRTSRNNLPKEDARKDSVSKVKNYAPIFKRGSLTSVSTSSVDGGFTDSSVYSNCPPPPIKRVSFTSQQPSREYWPTRNGPAQEPPTRQTRNSRPESSDSDVFLPNSPRSPIYDNTRGTYSNAGPLNPNNPQDQGYRRTVKNSDLPPELQAPNRPLPPIPHDASTRGEYGTVASIRKRDAKSLDRAAVAGPMVSNSFLPQANRWQIQSESESGSEAGEVQRILQLGGGGRTTHNRFKEEEWGTDGKNRGPPGCEQSGSGGGGRDEELRRGGGGGGGRPGRRDDPRRHTLSGDHHQQHQGGSLARSMDLESPLPRGYPPPSTAMLFDDDPGIMSEVETSSTGFRRGGKQRSSLPVVRTPSKTLERPLGKSPVPPGMLRVSAGHHHHQQQPHLNHHHHHNNKHSPPTPNGGLVFLQYRNETKRALLPNEITSIDTVKALFVRSFPKQLTMEYLDSPHVKIYIHDSSKDMFYELEDLSLLACGRSHLRDIRDRSVLRLFESADVNGGVLPGAGIGVMAPSMWDQDQSYFSEPEFDSEYQHQHIHKSKSSSKSGSSGVPPQPYYMTHSYPPGGPGASATLPRGGPLLRAYSPAAIPPVPADRLKTLPQSGNLSAPPKPARTYQQHGAGPPQLGKGGTGPRVPDRIYGSFISPTERRDANLYSTPDRLHAESGYMSSPERGGPRAYPGAYPQGAPGYEDPYYSQYASRSGSITPVIDEEASDTELIDESYSLYGVKLPAARTVAPQPRSQFPAPAVVPYDATRIRVEHMERQLANLTGLVQKALTQTPTPREYLQVPAGTRDANYRNDDSYLRTDTKTPKLGKDKSVSFEKSVSFSDEPPDMNSPKQHSPQHAERTERERHKPAPPPKPVSLSPGQYEGRHVYRDLQLTPEMYNQLRGLQKKAKDLRQEVRNLRRMSQAQAHTVRETIRDTFIKIRAMLLSGGEDSWSTAGDAETARLNREEDSYKQEMLRLEKDLTELESTVEELRGNVINRKTRVNMSDVENMALILSKSSKTVADLKVRFPGLQEGMKSMLSSEMEKVVREEKFLKEEPERLESALRRCKKLTGTLVTLKRLASVQEQRLPPSGTPDSRLSPTLGDDSDTPITPPAHGKSGAVPARSLLASPLGSDSSLSRQRPENALDALLDELQTFARPPSNPGHNPPMAEIGRKGSIDSAHPSSIPGTTSSLRRLHSYPSSSDGGGNSPPTIALARLQVSGSADAPKSPATSPKPPVPERNSELLSHLSNRRMPPPPPPRTSSRSPLSSPTSPSLPPRGQPQMGVGSGTLRRGAPGRSSLRGLQDGKPPVEEPQGHFNPLSASNSSSCESINSQEGAQGKSNAKARQEVLEQRHQELLRKQRALQEQYARLQQLQRGAGGLSVAPPPDLLLKKTGSESNLLAKMGLGPGLSAAAPMSGSLTHLAASSQSATSIGSVSFTTAAPTTTTTTTTTNKIYETDIL